MQTKINTIKIAKKTNVAAKRHENQLYKCSDGSWPLLFLANKMLIFQGKSGKIVERENNSGLDPSHSMTHHVL